MKELNLRRVDVVKLALVVSVLYLILSFIILLLIFLVGSAFIPKQALPFAGLGFLLVIVGPIVYFIISFIVMLIVGLFLNLSLSITGGLPLRFKE
jgi:hypothetical protein